MTPDADTEEAGRPDDEADQDEVPDLDEEDYADVSEIAQEVQEETQQESDQESDETDEETEASDETPATTDEDTSESTPDRSGQDGRDWGDLYVSSLTTGLNAVIDEYGKEGAEPIDESTARDLHLDEAMNDWMAKRERSQLEPEQELLVGTMILSLSVIATETTLFSEIMEDMDL